MKEKNSVSVLDDDKENQESNILYNNIDYQPNFLNKYKIFPRTNTNWISDNAINYIMDG